MGLSLQGVRRLLYGGGLRVGEAMKYKTVRESRKIISLLVLLLFGLPGMFCTLFILLTVDDAVIDQVSFLGLYMGLLSILWFLDCFTGNIKRKIFIKYGEKLKGNIIAAESLINGKGEDTYYLLISFYEGGLRKIRYTEGYEGSPNYKLKSADCEIYKWHNRYIETGFKALDKKEKPVHLNIPISKYHIFKKKKGYV